MYPFLFFLAVRTYAKKSYMAVYTSISAGELQQAIQAFQHGVLDFDLTFAVSTNDMVMLVARDLVG